MSVGQIPASSISRYVQQHDLSPDEAEFTRAVIRSLDSVYLSYQSQKPPDDKIVDFARVDDPVGVSTILKRLGAAAKARNEAK